MKPITKFYENICVVRDDLYEGGTKARIFDYLYSQYNEIIYVCAPFSRTQVSLARKAAQLGKKATLFLAARAKMTTETALAMDFGAEAHFIRPGYMNVIRKRALDYAAETGGWVAPLGFDTPETMQILVDAAKMIDVEPPEEVWCAAGSGTLTRALQAAWPDAHHIAVQVGGVCSIGRATRMVHELKLEAKYVGQLDFPADRNYEAKAWQMCKAHCTRTKRVLFWNVMGETDL